MIQTHADSITHSQFKPTPIQHPNHQTHLKNRKKKKNHQWANPPPPVWEIEKKKESLPIYTVWERVMFDLKKQGLREGEDRNFWIGCVVCLREGEDRNCQFTLSKREWCLFGLVVLYLWVDLLLLGFRIWWYCWVWEYEDFEIFNFWILIFGFVFIDLGLCFSSIHP